MSSTYSSNLAIELIGTGDQAGSWGNTTNTNLGTLIEQAISGYVTQAVSTGTDTTITIPNGATGVARNMYIELTGTGGTNTNLIVPANKKLYFIFNNSTGDVTVKVSGQTGVSVPTGKKMVLVSNGTDVVNGLNYIADFGTNSFTVTNLTATSASITTLTGTSAGITTLSSGSANITQLNSTSATITTLTGTSANITTLSGTTATFTSATVTNLALTSLTLSNLSIASANITTLTSGSATITNLINSGGTANGVLYLNASKVATSGSALQFDGTNLSVGGTAVIGLPIEITGATSGVSFKTSASNFTYGAVYTTTSLMSFEAGKSGTGTYVPMAFKTDASEQMRLTSTGLGIGTSSPTEKLSLNGNIGLFQSGVTRIYNTQSTNDSVKLGGALNIEFETYSGSAWSTKMLLDNSGNLGLGVTPSAWATVTPALEMRNGVHFATLDTTTPIGYLGANAFYNGSNWIYKTSSQNAVRYELNAGGNGSHAWFNAPSGTAGNTISFTQAMTLDASGNLLVGATSALGSAANRGNVTINGATDAILSFGNAASLAGYILQDSGGMTILSAGSTYQRFYTNSTERARITAAGDVGIGTSSPATLLDVRDGVGSVVTLGNTGTFVAGESSRIRFRESSTQLADIGWEADTNEVRINNRIAGPMTFYTNNTERARITSGGDLLVGTTSNTGSYRLRVESAGTALATFKGAEYCQVFVTDGTRSMYQQVYDNLARFGTSSSTPLAFVTADTERARITSDGYFLVNKTTANYGHFEVSSQEVWISYFVNSKTSGDTRGLRVSYSGISPNNTADWFLFCEDSTVQRASIRSNGGLANYQSNNVDLSDARTKKDITPAASMWDKIGALEIVTYKYNDQTHDDVNVGVIAQQVESVEPVWVDNDGWGGETPEDGVPLKTVYTKDITFAAIKALQEAMARIEQLEAKVAALETK